MTYSLTPFDQNDRDFIFSLKRKFSLDDTTVDRLWEIYLKLYSTYPKQAKCNNCSSTLNNVLNECIEKILSNEEASLNKVELKAEIKKKGKSK